MRKVYLVLTGLMLLAVVAQFYFAAVGAFARPQQDTSFVLHDVTGTLVIPVLAILATVVALVARVPGRLVGLTILPLGLIVVQVLIVVLGKAFDDGDTTSPAALAVLGLHAINGLAVMAVAGTVFARARALANAAPATTPAGIPA